jgi:hypothetical protein
LEYIENNCTNNYINPKINLNYEQDFTIEASFKPLGNTTTSNRCCILSSHDKSTTPSISLENYSNKLLLGINRSMEEPRVNTVYGTIIPNSKNIIKVQYTPITDASGTRTDSTVSVTVNGYTSTGNKGAFKTANLSPYIFVDATKSFSSFTVPMQLYSMKIYSNNSLIANLIPALNESTQTPGLVNLVTGEFLPNAEGDKFKYSEYTSGGLTFNGRNGDNSSYRVLEYIESTGTQYIDTGVSPTANTIAEINFIPTGGLTENAIFGSTWAANGYFLMFYNNKIRWHSKGDSEDIGNFKVGDTVVCKCASLYIEVNGNRFTMTGTGTDTSDSIKLLGKMSYSGSSGGGGIGRVKYFKI